MGESKEAGSEPVVARNMILLAEDRPPPLCHRIAGNCLPVKGAEGAAKPFTSSQARAIPNQFPANLTVSIM